MIFVTDGGWFYTDENEVLSGPFTTREEAQTEYVKWLNKTLES